MLRTVARTSAVSAIISARTCWTPWRISTGVGSSFSGLTIVGNTSSSLATAGSRFQIAKTNGSRTRLPAAGPRLPFFRFLRRLKIFESLRCLRSQDGTPQIVCQLSLPFDALENRLLALGELAELLHARLNPADQILVEPARPLLAVARDERDRIALVEQLDHALH